jgi:tetratricopeptide (TPR) repeat protein
MGRFARWAMVCALSALTPSLGSPNPQNSASLAGTVFSDVDNQRISNASVILCDDQGHRLEETSSDDAGEFSLNGIRPQHYLLQVRAAGFEAVELHVDLTLTSQHGLSIALRPVGVERPSAPDRPTISARELSIPEAARDLLSSGMHKLYKENNPQGALEDFQAASAKAPSFYEAYFRAGLAYLALHQETQAERQFRKSFEISQKKYSDAEIALATLLLRREPGGEGEALLRQGLLLNPQSWPGQVELGKIELEKGHLELALAAAEKAESLAPGQPMVYRLLAVVHLKAKDYPAAMSDLDGYIRLDPDSPAGVRAKELRAQLEQQLAKSKGSAVSATK